MSEGNFSRVLLRILDKWEIWWDIPRYEGLYQVSTWGNVKSLVQRRFKKLGNNRVVEIPLGILETTKDHDGYVFVSLWDAGGCRKSLRVHRIVLETFVGVCPPKMECRHLDGDPKNNHLVNICWGTRSENNKDRTRHGRWVSPFLGKVGELHHSSRLRNCDVPKVHELYSSGLTIKQVGDSLGVSETVVLGVLHGNTYKNSQPPLEKRAKMRTAAGANLRGRFGERCYAASLKDADIPEIHRLYISGYTTSQIGEMYGVHRCTIRRILCGKNYRNAQPPVESRAKLRRSKR